MTKGSSCGHNNESVLLWVCPKYASLCYRGLAVTVGRIVTMDDAFEYTL